VPCKPVTEHLEVVDSHLHIWDADQPYYAWLKPGSPISRKFEPADVEDALERCGVGRIVLVQAADCEEDTTAMARTAEEWARVAGVVGWIPIDDPDLAAATIDRLGSRICGGVIPSMPSPTPIGSAAPMCSMDSDCWPPVICLSTGMRRYRFIWRTFLRYLKVCRISE
jgi:predicted TIM-barrel fold metal-dependent hydrolase